MDDERLSERLRRLDREAHPEDYGAAAADEPRSHPAPYDPPADDPPPPSSYRSAYDEPAYGGPPAGRTPPPEANRRRRTAGEGPSRLVVALVAAIVLLAVLAGTLFAFGIGLIGGDPVAEASATPTTAPSASISETSASATASPSADASASPAATATPVAGPDLPLDALVETTVDSLTVRRDAGTSGEALGVIALGTDAFLLSGPVEVNGLPWYLLTALGLPANSGCLPDPPGQLQCPSWLGWVAGAGPDGTPWLTPVSLPSCPATPTVDDLALIPWTMRLACYGDQELTISGFYPEIPDDAGLGGACAASEHEMGWLICQNINYDGLASESQPGFPGSVRVTVDPESGVTMPDRGQWLDVTGHFDDPRSEGCSEVGAGAYEASNLVFRCRIEFVVTSVEVVPGP